MVATPHAFAGAFASRFARTSRGALAAGVISHMALDRIPHTDYRLANRKALFADLAAATLLTGAFARRHRLAAAGAFGGVLPDLAMVAELRTGLRVTARCTTPTTPRSNLRSRSACSPRSSPPGCCSPTFTAPGRASAAGAIAQDRRFDPQAACETAARGSRASHSRRADWPGLLVLADGRQTARSAARRPIMLLRAWCSSATAAAGSGSRAGPCRRSSRAQSRRGSARRFRTGAGRRRSADTGTVRGHPR